MSDIPPLSENEVTFLRNRITRRKSIALDYDTKRALLIVCDMALELAALRARHEKLRDGCKALVEVWRDTANYGTDPDKSAAERLLFDTVHAHADELNALLEDE